MALHYISQNFIFRTQIGMIELICKMEFSEKVLVHSSYRSNDIHRTTVEALKTKARG